MMNARQALFRAILNESDGSGDVKAPCGYFAGIQIYDRQYDSILEEYKTVTDIYGTPEGDSVVGLWFVWMDSQGFVHTASCKTTEELGNLITQSNRVYESWLSQDDEQRFYTVEADEKLHGSDRSQGRIGIVDTSKGGIIAWALSQEHADLIVDALREKEE